MPTGIYFPSDDQLAVSWQEYETLQDYQSAVGGYIEAIPVGVEDLSFFGNEEAKLIGLPINRRATLFWWLHTPAARRQDVLAGDVVLVGSTDEGGETLDVPDDIQCLLLMNLSYAVEFIGVGATCWHRSPLVFKDYFEASAWALDLAQRRNQVGQVRVTPRA